MTSQGGVLLVPGGYAVFALLAATSESMPLLLPPRDATEAGAAPSERGQKIIDYLAQHGASFFSEIHTATGGGFPGNLGPFCDAPPVPGKPGLTAGLARPFTVA